MLAQDRLEVLGLELDLAERALRRALGRGRAAGDRPRADAAHHHALEDGLAADGGVTLRDQAAEPGIGLGDRRLSLRLGADGHG